MKDESPIYRDPRAAAEAGLAGIPAPPTYPFVMENFGAFPELQPDDGPHRTTRWPRCSGR